MSFDLRTPITASFMDGMDECLKLISTYVFENQIFGVGIYLEYSSFLFFNNKCVKLECYIECEYFINIEISWFQN